MTAITFEDRETEKRALAFLIGRFSGRVLRSGEHLVPEAAIEALADQNIPFSVRGKATYEQQMAAFRGAAARSVQLMNGRCCRSGSTKVYIGLGTDDWGDCAACCRMR